MLGGKEFRLNKKSSFGIDTKITWAGGQRYTDFDYAASASAGYVVFNENEAYQLQNGGILNSLTLVMPGELRRNGILICKT